MSLVYSVAFKNKNCFVGWCLFVFFGVAFFGGGGCTHNQRYIIIYIYMRASFIDALKMYVHV